VASRFRHPQGLLVRPQAVAVQADRVQVVTHRVPVVAAQPVLVVAAQPVLVVAAQVVPVEATGRVASVDPHAALVVVAVVAIKTSCNRSSPHTRLQMHPYRRALSSSSGACRHKNSLLSSIAPRLTSFGSC
jgi:hypothetical protein